jgi:translation initiation factor 2 beta subunit (eIF-2beta)/eIF-5
MIPKYRNFTRDNSEGENQISWNPTEMVPKYRNFTWDNSEGEDRISWDPAEMIRKVKFPKNDSAGEKISSFEYQQLDWFAISYEGSLVTFLCRLVGTNTLLNPKQLVLQRDRTIE